MSVGNGNPNEAVFEDKFARVYADIRRLDQLRASDRESERALLLETVRRLDEKMSAADTAVAAALAAAEKAVAAALSAADKATNKAEQAQLKVNETQNEFRGSLKDQATTLMPRAESENIFRELRALIATQTTILGELRSRVDVGPPSLKNLQTRSDESVGAQRGGQENKAAIYAALSGAVAVVSVIIAVAVALLN